MSPWQFLGWDMKCDSVRGRHREEQREIEGQLLGIMGKDQAGIKVTEGPGSFLSDVLERIYFEMGFLSALCGGYIRVHCLIL